MAATVSEQVRAHVAGQLAKVEEEHQVRVLLAVESGSRAWGFPSPDSDYDVRFLYVHRPEWYLSVKRRRDVIELPLDDVWDINGWDLRKALGLLLQSNPVLLEWLCSPVVYRADEAFLAAMRNLARAVNFQTASRYHYLHLAESQYRRYVEDKEEVRLKKYFYVLRPALALMWLRLRPGESVPMNFQALCDGLPLSAEVRELFAQMLARKRQTKELGSTARLPAFDTLIEEQLAWAREAPDEKLPSATLYPRADALLYQTVMRAAAVEA